MTRRPSSTVEHRRGARAAAVVLLLCLASGTAPAADREPIRPAGDDRCPVCGMFTAKYPDFAARVTFSDDASFTFDGPKDMFTFLLDLAKFAPDRSRSDVEEVLVTEYYELVAIDAETALYVIGSDVRGPMGHELIAFSNREDAEVFKKDHRGTALLEFGEVTAALITSLGRMR